jgi:hypothetical protein
MLTTPSLRPVFTAHDRERFLVTLAQARRLTARCSESERYGSWLYQVCLGMLASIEAMADELADDISSRDCASTDAKGRNPCKQPLRQKSRE